MKSLLALFAVTAVLGVAAIAAPASAADARIKMKCDWTQSREDQKSCVCVAEVRENKLIDGRQIWLSTWRPAICPANGGGGGFVPSDEPSKPHMKHEKTVSKAESKSSVESKAYFDWWGNPVAKTEQKEHTTSYTTGPGGAAGADAGTSGGALAATTNSISGGISVGSTDGSSCVGTGC